MLLSGCFYIDPIVPRTLVQIDLVEPKDPSRIFRGGHVSLSADSIDPDTGLVEPDTGLGTYDWRVLACTEYPIRGDDCDAPFYASGAEPKNTVDFSVPVTTTTGQALTQAIRVLLVARGARGALARVLGNGDFPVGDAPPALELSRSARSPGLSTASSVRPGAWRSDAAGLTAIATALSWSVGARRSGAL